MSTGISPEEAFRRKRPLWEYFLLFFLVAVAVVSGFFTLHNQRTHMKKMLLRHELMRIRRSVLFYRALYGEMPSDLAMLTALHAVDQKSGQSYPIMEDVKIDANNNVIDPFGYPYSYNRLEGFVASTAPCCKDW